MSTAEAREAFHLMKLDSDTPRSCLAEIAEIHRKEIPDGFLSSLNPRFLVKMYQTFSASKHSFVFAAKQGDSIVGFICCSFDTGKAYRDFLIRSGAHSLLILIRSLFSFKTLTRMVEVLAYPRKSADLALPGSEILNFSVSSQYQRQGIGTGLFNAAVSEYKRAGIDSMKIVVGASQSGAMRFYDCMHAELRDEICVHGKNKSYVYTFEFSDGGS